MGAKFNREDVTLGAIVAGRIPTDSSTATPPPTGLVSRAVDWEVLPSGSSGQVLTVNADGSISWQTSTVLSNPMTTAGDTIYGGASGVAARLAIGTATQVLTVNSGATAPQWSNPTPMTTAGDTIYGGAAGVTTRLAIGTAGQVLTVNSGATAPQWANSTALTNPMTTAGDTIYGGASGVPTQLSIGTAGQVLTVNAGATAVTWAKPGSTTTSADASTIAYGPSALGLVTSGTNNAAFGVNALANVTTGSGNVGLGYNACCGATGGAGITGAGNCGVGENSLEALTTGQYNIGIGLDALQYATTANFLTAVGYAAGAGQTTAGSGTFIGAYAGKYETAANVVLIDNINRTNLAGGRAGAPLYAVTNATVASQTVQLNGLVTIGTLPLTFGSNHMTWGAAAPSTGTWAAGDICWNTGVTASTSPGWVCTTAGSSGGTWTAMPVL
jgi:hypothetical protein